MVRNDLFQEYFDSHPHVAYASIIEDALKRDDLGNPEDWGKKEIYRLFEGKRFVGVSATYNALSTIKSFVQFVCDKTGKTPSTELDEIKIGDLVDLNRLLSITFTEEQVYEIVDQMKSNVRDRVIIELAYSGFTQSQIANIRYEDIRVTEESGVPSIAFITVKKRNKDLVIKIDDPNWVADINRCIRTDEYYTVAIDGKIKHTSIQNTGYLIRPVGVGKGANTGNKPISNLSATLAKAIRAEDINCRGANPDDITIENLNRSKIIYMLSPKMIQDSKSSVEFVKMYFGKTQRSDNTFLFYRQIAAIKFPLKKE